MGKTKTTRGFNIPMHLAVSKDSLRPAMVCVYFERGYMYATNAHIAVKAKTSSFTDFDEEEIARLEGKFIDGHLFKELYRKPLLQVKPEGILDIENNIMYLFKERDYKFPNVDAVLIQKPAEETDGKVQAIGYNPTFMKLISDIVLKASGSSHVKLEFAGQNKAITVSSDAVDKSELVGIVMPVMLS